MPRRSREATSAELSLWRHAMRDVRQLTAPEVDEEPQTAPPAEPPREEGLQPPASESAPPVTTGRGAATTPAQEARTGLAAGQIDRRSWQRLQRGQYPISARLDLHGLSQDEAFVALVRFVTRQQERGARCVLIITGRGLRTGGILRTMTPRWLESPPLAPLVLSWAPARIAHGGEGALYVLLRRKR